jgi:hypothetical protein
MNRSEVEGPGPQLPRRGRRLPSGAWETLSGRPTGKGGSQGRRGLCTRTIAAALLDKGVDKEAFRSGHAARHPGRPQEVSSRWPPTQHPPNAPHCRIMGASWAPATRSLGSWAGS